MPFRSQAALQAGIRAKPRTWFSAPPRFGKVIGVNAKQGTVHVILDEGNVVRNVRVVGQGAGGTRGGTQDLPQVLLRDPQPEPEHQILLDEFQQAGYRDTMALIVFAKDQVHRPFAFLMPPDFHQASLDEPNLRTERHASDVYELTYALDNPDPNQLSLQLKQSGGQGRTATQTNAGNEDQPSPWDYPRKASWERVFPDRRRLEQPDAQLQRHPPAFEPPDPNGTSAGIIPLGLETYELTGFPDKPLGGLRGKAKPRGSWDFQETPLSAQPKPYPDKTQGLARRPIGHQEKGLENYDSDSQPWTRHTENGVRFARGWRLNQRWGSFIELSRSGDLRLLAEGLNKQVNPEVEGEVDKPGNTAEDEALIQNPNWGSTYLMSRIETRLTDKGEWEYHRKRWRKGGRLEEFSTRIDEGKEDDHDDVRKWGQKRVRVQRTYHLLSRKLAAMGARGETQLLAGHIDAGEGEWSRGDPGEGGDFPRYQDRKKWRNRDCDERGDITLQSVREKMETAFGDDPPLRGPSDGGVIALISAPEESDRAPISLQSRAARNASLIELRSTTRNVVSEGQGDDAGIHLYSGAYRDQGHVDLEAEAGTGGKGQDAKITLSAHTRQDDAGVTVLARSGDSGQGSDAHATVTAQAQDDHASIDLLATTIQGNDAALTGFARPKHGTASIDYEAISPDQAVVSMVAHSAGYANAEFGADDDVLVQASRKTLHLVAGKRVTVEAGERIELDADVYITGTLYVNGVAVNVP